MPTRTQRKQGRKAGNAVAKRVRVGYNINVWIDSQVGEAFEAFVSSIEPRTSKSAVLELLIREHLKGKGLWPPNPVAPEQPGSASSPSPPSPDASKPPEGQPGA